MVKSGDKEEEDMTINIPVSFNLEKINKFFKIIFWILFFILFILLFTPFFIFEKNIILGILVLIIFLIIYFLPEIIKYLRGTYF